jgi:hypothetical protein
MSIGLTREPRVTERAEAYAAIRRSVTMQTISEIADRIPDIFA